MQAGLSCYEPGGAFSDGFYDKSYLQVNATNLKECKATVAALQAKGAPHFECVRHWSYQDRFFLGHSKDEQCETIAATLTDGGCSKGGNAIAVECDDTDNILYWGECGYQWDGNGWRDDIYIFRGALGDASMDTSSYQWDGKGWQDVKEIIYHVCKDTARWCKSIFVACIIISSIFACQILPLLNGI